MSYSHRVFLRRLFFSTTLSVLIAAMISVVQVEFSGSAFLNAAGGYYIAHGLLHVSLSQKADV